MYCIVSWDISAEGQIWREQNEKMKHCFSAVKSAKPVFTYYLVRLPSVNSITELHKNFETVRTTAPVDIFYIISPVFRSLGGFRGYLEGSEGQRWIDVNAVVKGDVPVIAPTYPPITPPLNPYSNIRPRRTGI